jgi:hypothetical protein
LQEILVPNLFLYSSLALVDSLLTNPLTDIQTQRTSNLSS